MCVCVCACVLSQVRNWPVAVCGCVCLEHLANFCVALLLLLLLPNIELLWLHKFLHIHPSARSERWYKVEIKILMKVWGEVRGFLGSPRGFFKTSVSYLILYMTRDANKLLCCFLCLIVLCFGQYTKFLHLNDCLSKLKRLDTHISVMERLTLGLIF